MSIPSENEIREQIASREQELTFLKSLLEIINFQSMMLNQQLENMAEEIPFDHEDLLLATTFMQREKIVLTNRLKKMEDLKDELHKVSYSLVNIIEDIDLQINRFTVLKAKPCISCKEVKPVNSLSGICYGCDQ
jgi:hypothetical protein